MSFLKKIFQKKKFSEETVGKENNPQQAIQKLMETEEILIKKQELLEKKIKNELEIAKKNGTKDKKVALQALKRKKKYEKELNHIDQILINLECNRNKLESASTNAEVLKSIKFASDAFKVANQNMKAKDVEKLKDCIDEQMETADYISKTVSSLIEDDYLDDKELMNELEQLEQETLGEQLIRLPNTDPMPDVPDEPITETIMSSFQKFLNLLRKKKSNKYVNESDNEELNHPNSNGLKLATSCKDISINQNNENKENKGNRFTRFKSSYLTLNKKNKKIKVEKMNEINKTMQQTDNRIQVERKQSEPLIKTPKSPKFENIKKIASKSKSLNSLFKISNDQTQEKDEFELSKSKISKSEINDIDSINEYFENEKVDEELMKQNLEYELLRDNINEQKSLADEINDIISSPGYIKPEIDDNQLIQELKDLEYSSFQSNNISIKPNRPKPKPRVKHEQKQLEELIEWARR